MQKIDNLFKMVYNKRMEQIKIAIIGGGASGLMIANVFAQYADQPLSQNTLVVFERGDRVGKKLSSTGNGQGNISNANLSSAEYFSSDLHSLTRVAEELSIYGGEEHEKFWTERGVLLFADDRGRKYPSGRQASALTDALRFYASQRGVSFQTKSLVLDIKKSGQGFELLVETEKGKEKVFAEKVVLCTGGKAAKNFGTDGSAYALATKFGHTLTPLYPSLVQLKTETSAIKSLKGIRVVDGKATAHTSLGEKAFRGDIIFTDYGISGDAVFRLSAYVVHEISDGQVRVELDFLPDVAEEKLTSILTAKRKEFPDLPFSELFFGIVNNQIGRAIARLSDGDLKKAVKLIKAFPLKVTGSLGFDYAQVTKGGIPLSETDLTLQSKFVAGLYFAGEILDIDGCCGGYNLQWAYTSACTVAHALLASVYAKDGGTV